ncbi:unnamed protein product [Cochlearia groenlandica]
MEVSVIASSSIDGGIGRWDLKTGEENLRFKSCATPPSAKNSSPPLSSVTHPLPLALSSSGLGTRSKKLPCRVSIKAISANSEGTYIVGGGNSGDIYLWEVSTGKLLKKCHGHYRSVTCLVFSGDDSLLVSGSQDGSVRVWSLVRLFDDFQRQQGNTLYEHSFNEHTMSVTDIVIDYGGCNAMIVVSASEDRTCKIWSLSKGKLLRNIIFPFAINALALDPGGSVFYAGARDSNIYLGAINSTSDYGTQALGSVSEECKAVTCLSYCTDGNLLISGSEDGVICIWNPKSRRPVRTFSHGKGPVNNVQVVRKTIVSNSNKTQSSWKRHGSSIPPPLEKYERSGEESNDAIVTVDPSPLTDAPVYSPFLSADLINDQVKELQQQGSASTEIEMGRLKLEYKKSLKMNNQWQKNYENLLEVVMDVEQNCGTI